MLAAFGQSSKFHFAINLQISFLVSLFLCIVLVLPPSFSVPYFFIYNPLEICKTNYLLHCLLITLQNTTRTIIPRGAIDYDNPVAINIERNKNYRVNQERRSSRPQSRTQEPPTDSHNLLRIDDALKLYIFKWDGRILAI